MEAVGQDVLDEAAQEGHGMQGGRAVAPRPERDMAGADVQQAGVRHAHAVGIAPQVAKNVLGVTERGLCIDDPALVGREAGHQAAQARGRRPSGVASAGRQHLPPQQPAHDLDREQVILPTVDEPLPLECQPTGRGQHVDVRMEAYAEAKQFKRAK